MQTQMAAIRSVASILVDPKDCIPLIEAATKLLGCRIVGEDSDVALVRQKDLGNAAVKQKNFTQALGPLRNCTQNSGTCWFLRHDWQ